MLFSILVGVFLAVCTIGIHATGTASLVRYLRKRTDSFVTRFGEPRILTVTGVALLLLHWIEVFVWALVYLFIVGQQENFQDAIYFSAVTMASLGYGDVVVSGSWRLLSAFQAMTGLLVFGWSSATFFAVVQRFWQQKFESDAREDSRQSA